MDPSIATLADVFSEDCLERLCQNALVEKRAMDCFGYTSILRERNRNNIKLTEILKSKEALKLFKEILKVDTQKPDLWFFIGMCYQKGLKDLELAKEHYINSLKLDQDNLEVRECLADSFFLLKDYFQASKHYERVIYEQTSFQNTDLYIKYLTTQAHLGHTEIKPLLETLIGSEEVNYLAQQALIQLEINQSNYLEAIERLDYLLKTLHEKDFESKSYLLRIRGICNHNMGQVERAIFDFEKSLKSNIFETESYFCLAQTYDTMEDVEKAIATYIKAYNLSNLEASEQNNAMFKLFYETNVEEIDALGVYFEFDSETGAVVGYLDNRQIISEKITYH